MIFGLSHECINQYLSFSGASDFTPLENEVLTIPSTMAVSNSVCRSVNVTSDMIVEESESFNITVEMSNPNDVIMGLNTAAVTIEDDDSK